MSYRENEDWDTKVFNVIFFIFLCIVVLVWFIWLTSRWLRWYSRRQNILDTNNNIKISQLNANNQVQLNEIQIQQTKQLIEVENQKAEIKVAEAKGIAEAQKIINETLTDKYLQHEAIQVQEKMAASPNHTTVYIPVGNNGIPVVKTIQ